MTRRSIELALLSLATCIVLWRFFALYAVISPHAVPDFAVFEHAVLAPPLAAYGWWSGFDQGKYLEAASAWLRGNLNPAHHFYPPGYPLLGAVLLPLLPQQPFMPADILCLVGSLWLCSSLACRLLGGVQHARAIGALVFIATTVLPGHALRVWVEPWSTTGAAPFITATLLAAIRFADHTKARDAFFTGLAGMTTVAFRPADGAPLFAVIGGAALWGAWRYWPGWRRATLIAASAGAGAALPLALFGGAYLAIYGWTASDYLLTSQAIGFEWRLLPLRWVTLMIDPQPLYPEGRGLAVFFPCIMPGLAGMAACLIKPGPERRLPHALVIGVCLVECVLLLTYRDIHLAPLGYFSNFHYFKWIQPVFGIYTVLLVRAFVRAPRWLAPACAAFVVLGFVMWRIDLTNPHQLPLADRRGLTLPQGLSPIDTIVFARASGDPGTIEGWYNYIHTGETVFESTLDFKMTPWVGTIMVMPLRPFPAVPSRLETRPDVIFDQAVAPVAATQSMVWGVPCWFLRTRRDCRARFLIPPPTMPLGDTINFTTGGGSDAFIGAGWYGAGPQGRWTVGPKATIAFASTAPRLGAEIVLTLTAYGFVPDGTEPVIVKAVVNNVTVARWRFGATPMTVSATLPRSAQRDDHAIQFDLEIANPRSPLATMRGATDPNALGLFMEKLSLVEVGGAPAVR